MPAALFSDLDVQATTDAPLGATTWYGIGGRADLLIKPNTIEDLTTLVKRCDRSGTPLRVLGGGANLLVADEGVDGIVISLDSPVFREIKYNRQGEINTMRAYAGADMPKTLMDVTRQGLAGISQLAGIPGQVGGIIKMNAGGTYGCVGDAVASVTCITKRGELVTYPASELRFEYRKTNIPDPVIVAATFNLEPTDPIALRDKVKEIFAFKKSTQPLADSSAGCTFKNPINPVTEERVPAGKLIDEAGLKGQTIGGASVSTQHANFIVTQPGATADDVMQLLALIKQRVFDHAGLELQTEVVIWKREEEGI
ncbi:MAG: UDP-N-acetylmuramate dehydrogenase [Planctomycetes bacterium]|nr:UDP-N-acetylmuramate dehydrogenase [Planctomycetota bacterium]